jgi:hypothetical protein
MSELTQGDRVRHPGVPEWGLGEVLDVPKGGEVRVFFVEAGEKTLALRHVTLEIVPFEQAQHAVLDNLARGKKGGFSRYRSFAQSRGGFLQKFPEGFYDEQYLAEERDYKVEAHELAQTELGQTELNTLIGANDHEEVCRRALRVVNKTNLIFPQEKMALRDGVKSSEGQSAFATALHGMLHGEGDLQARFEVISSALSGIGAAKWPTVTYLPFIFDPVQHMFVKPMVTQRAAETSGFDIAYQPELNWHTYHRVLEFSRYLFDELEDQKPRDMIDVQSFIWCIDPGKARR